MYHFVKPPNSKKQRRCKGKQIRLENAEHFPTKTPRETPQNPRVSCFPESHVLCWPLETEFQISSWELKGHTSPSNASSLIQKFEKVPTCLEVRKGKVCVKKSAPLEKGQSRSKMTLISCASTSHDASNVPPFLSLIGDGR